ncbi:MAG: IS66 family transposase [Acidobacteria bacterium]|nr:IS66 family transposase [Acidobacteriota bacterium]
MAPGVPEGLEGGGLQVDASPGYNAILELDRIIAAYCWAHARRKYIEHIWEVFTMEPSHAKAT